MMGESVCQCNVGVFFVVVIMVWFLGLMLGGQRGRVELQLFKKPFPCLAHCA